MYFHCSCSSKFKDLSVFSKIKFPVPDIPGAEPGFLVVVKYLKSVVHEDQFADLAFFVFEFPAEFRSAVVASFHKEHVRGMEPLSQFIR